MLCCVYRWECIENGLHTHTHTRYTRVYSTIYLYNMSYMYDVYCLRIVPCAKSSGRKWVLKIVVMHTIIMWWLGPRGGPLATSHTCATWKKKCRPVSTLKPVLLTHSLGCSKLPEKFDSVQQVYTVEYAKNLKQQKVALLV